MHQQAHGGKTFLAGAVGLPPLLWDLLPTPTGIPACPSSDTDGVNTMIYFVTETTQFHQTAPYPDGVAEI